MTTFIARSGGRTSPTTALSARTQQFTRSLVSVGSLVLDAIEATRSLGSAHSAVDRRSVLDRFAADTTRDAGRSAA